MRILAISDLKKVSGANSPDEDEDPVEVIEVNGSRIKNDAGGGFWGWNGTWSYYTPDSNGGDGIIGDGQGDDAQNDCGLNTNPTTPADELPDRIDDIRAVAPNNASYLSNLGAMYGDMSGTGQDYAEYMALIYEDPVTGEIKTTMPHTSGNTNQVFFNYDDFTVIGGASIPFGATVVGAIHAQSSTNYLSKGDFFAMDYLESNAGDQSINFDSNAVAYVVDPEGNIAEFTSDAWRAAEGLEDNQAIAGLEIDENGNPVCG